MVLLASSTPSYRTMHLHVLDRLGVEVVSGSPPVGQVLDPEPVLAARLGVSRGALREAVKALAAKGMVELRPRTGTRVLARSHWNVLDARVLSWLRETDVESLAEHLTEVRRLLEPGAAALAAERVLDEEAGALRSAQQAMADAHRTGDLASFTAADIEFHQVLLRLTHNPLLPALNSSLELALQLTFEITATAPGALEATLPLHREVAEAVAAHESARARIAMEVLLDTSARDFAGARSAAARERA